MVKKRQRARVTQNGGALLFVIVLLIILTILIASLMKLQKKENNPGNTLNDSTRCNVGSDCVPKECCHATSCVNKEIKQDCGRTFCTQECKQGTIDCGQGSCGCINNKCAIVLK